MRIHFCLPVALAFVLHSVPDARAQGSLAPLGAPGATMRTLEQIEPRTPVTNLPSLISQPGAYYLTRSLSGANGIMIAADNVTLDLNGFSMIGNGSGTAIFISGTRTQLAVMNGFISNWTAAISFANASMVRIEDISVCSLTGSGIDAGDNAILTRCAVRGATGDGIQAGDNAIVTDCQSVSNMASGNGINVGDNAVVRGCTARQNSGSGFRASANFSALNCASRENGVAGFMFGYASSLQNCSARANISNGFTTASSGMSLTGCGAYGNGGMGYYLTSGSAVQDCSAYRNFSGFTFTDGCIFKGCTAMDNTEYGFFGYNQNLLSDCVSATNDLDGIRMTTHNLIRNCNISANGDNGIEVTSDNQIEGCSVGKNSTHGIQGTSNNRIQGNHLIGNGQSLATAGSGIYLTSSDNVIDGNICNLGDFGIRVTTDGSMVIRNHCTGNLTNFQIAVNNKVGPIVVASNSPAISGSAGGSGTGSTDPWANYSY